MRPIEVAIDALENAGFQGTWEYPAGRTALVCAIETAEIVIAALEDAGFLDAKTPARLLFGW